MNLYNTVYTIPGSHTNPGTKSLQSTNRTESPVSTRSL